MSRVIKADHLHYSEQKRGISQIKSSKKNSEEKTDSKTETKYANETEQVFEETKKMLEEMIDNAKKKAEGILLEAKMNAETIQEEAHSEAESIRAVAFEEGYQQGYEKAMQDAQDTREKADFLLQQAFREKETMILDSEKEIVDFVLASIDAIVLQSAVCNQEVIVGLSKKLLDFAKDAKGQITIKTSPKDFALIEDHFEELDMIITTGSLQAKIDASLSPGTIIVISENGIVEVNIEENIEKVKAVLEGGRADD